MKKFRNVFDDWWPDPMMALGMLGGGAVEAIPWYLDDAKSLTASDVIAAYQAENSYDELYSRINLKYNGLYNLIFDGTANPPWSKENGWAFDGSVTRYIYKTGIVPTSGHTCIIKVKNHQLNQPIFGVGEGSLVYRIFPNHTNGRIYQNGLNASSTNAGPLTNGVFGMANKQPYHDGIAESNVISAGAQNFTADIWFGGINGGAGAATAWASGNILGYVQYNKVLSPAQMSTIMGKMALPLPEITSDPNYYSYFLGFDHSTSGLSTLRSALAAIVWPSGAPITGVDTITTGVSNPMSVTPTNLASTDQLLFHLANSIDMVGYKFIPISSNNKLVIFASGHNISQWISGQQEMVKALVEANYTVVAIRVPLGSDGTYNTLHNGTTGGGTLLSQFVDAAYRSINQFTGYDAYYMTGHSGGGWMTVISAALDERITKSAPCEGSLPSYCIDAGGSDWEQGRPGFKFLAEYTDLYLLGCTSGRKQTQFSNDQDGGGFTLANYSKKPYLSAMQKYTTGFDMWWGTSTDHAINAAERAAVLAFLAT